MFRNVFRLMLVFISAIFVRHVIMLIVRSVSRVGRATTPAPQASATQSSGELKQDPVCGTFVAVASSIKKTVNGDIVHFCSTECRDKYRRVA